MIHLPKEAEEFEPSSIRRQAKPHIPPKVATQLGRADSRHSGHRVSRKSGMAEQGVYRADGGLLR